jgi:hypothetical protein
LIVVHQQQPGHPSADSIPRATRKPSKYKRFWVCLPRDGEGHGTEDDKNRPSRDRFRTCTDNRFVLWRCRVGSNRVPPDVPIQGCSRIRHRRRGRRLHVVVCAQRVGPGLSADQTERARVWLVQSVL